MANFIVRAFQRRTLKKLSKNNKRRYLSLDDTRSVALVFNSQDPDIAEAIELLKRTFKERNISYMGLGISYTKDESTNTKLDHDPYIVQILKKEANWLGIPEIEQSDKFYDGEYDIVFDLSLTPSFPVEYSVKRCKSEMVIGFCPERENIYDIFISDKEGDIRSSITEHIKQSIQYLTIIKSK